VALHIFVSHPQEDRRLADAVTTLLVDGCGLSTDQVFCSSRPGAGVPAGQDFKHYMREQLAQTTLLIQLITPAYLDSTFCMFELGAAWVKEIETFPLVVRPVTTDALDAITGGVQAKSIRDRDDLDELMHTVSSQRRTTVDLETWRRSRTSFLRKAARLEAKVSGRRTVTVSEFDSVVARLAHAEVSGRLGDALPHLARAFEKVVQGYDFLQQVEQGRIRDKVFLSQLREAAVSLAEAFAVSTGASCRAIVKWLPEPPAEPSTLDAWPVFDLVRSDRPRRRPSGSDFVGNNTDFLQIMERQTSSFVDNDLCGSFLAGRYENSHWTRDAVEAGKVDYRASIVVPIGLFGDEPEGDDAEDADVPDVVGFLCVDASTTGSFDGQRDVHLAAVVANALYPVLDLYRQITSADEDA
jgi:hypothetical protein